MDFQNMKRKDLQALCKKHNLPANKTNLQMANNLTSLLKKPEVEPMSQVEPLKVGDGSAENDSTRKSKRVRFCLEEQSPLEDVKEIEDKTHLQLKSAMKPGFEKCNNQIVKGIEPRVTRSRKLAEVVFASPVKSRKPRQGQNAGNGDAGGKPSRGAPSSNTLSDNAKKKDADAIAVVSLVEGRMKRQRNANIATGEVVEESKNTSKPEKGAPRRSRRNTFKTDNSVALDEKSELLMKEKLAIPETEIQAVNEESKRAPVLEKATKRSKTKSQSNKKSDQSDGQLRTDGAVEKNASSEVEGESENAPKLEQAGRRSKKIVPRVKEFCKSDELSGSTGDQNPLQCITNTVDPPRTSCNRTSKRKSLSVIDVGPPSITNFVEPPRTSSNRISKWKSLAVIDVEPASTTNIVERPRTSRNKTLKRKSLAAIDEVPPSISDIIEHPRKSHHRTSKRKSLAVIDGEPPSITNIEEPPGTSHSRTLKRKSVEVVDGVVKHQKDCRKSVKQEQLAKAESSVSVVMDSELVDSSNLLPSTGVEQNAIPEEDVTECQKIDTNEIQASLIPKSRAKKSSGKGSHQKSLSNLANMKIESQKEVDISAKDLTDNYKSGVGSIKEALEDVTDEVVLASEVQSVEICMDQGLQVNAIPESAIPLVDVANMKIESQKEVAVSTKDLTDNYKSGVGSIKEALEDATDVMVPALEVQSVEFCMDQGLQVNAILESAIPLVDTSLKEPSPDSAKESSHIDEPVKPDDDPKSIGKKLAEQKNSKETEERLSDNAEPLVGMCAKSEEIVEVASTNGSSEIQVEASEFNEETSPEYDEYDHPLSSTDAILLSPNESTPCYSTTDTKDGSVTSSKSVGSSIKFKEALEKDKILVGSLEYSEEAPSKEISKQTVIENQNEHVEGVMHLSSVAGLSEPSIAQCQEFLKEKTMEMRHEGSTSNLENFDLMGSGEVDVKNEAEVSVLEEPDMKDVQEPSGVKSKEPLISPRGSVTTEDSFNLSNISSKTVSSSGFLVDPKGDDDVEKVGVEKVLEHPAEIQVLETSHDCMDGGNVAEDESTGAISQVYILCGVDVDMHVARIKNEAHEHPEQTTAQSQEVLKKKTVEMRHEGSAGNLQNFNLMGSGEVDIKNEAVVSVLEEPDMKDVQEPSGVNFKEPLISPRGSVTAEDCFNLSNISSKTISSSGFLVDPKGDDDVEKVGLEKILEHPAETQVLETSHDCTDGGNVAEDESIGAVCISQAYGPVDVNIEKSVRIEEEIHEVLEEQMTFKSNHDCNDERNMVEDEAGRTSCISQVYIQSTVEVEANVETMDANESLQSPIHKANYNYNECGNAVEDEKKESSPISQKAAYSPINAEADMTRTDEKAETLLEENIISEINYGHEDGGSSMSHGYSTTDVKDDYVTSSKSFHSSKSLQEAAEANRVLVGVLEYSGEAFGNEMGIQTDAGNQNEHVEGVLQLSSKHDLVGLGELSIVKSQEVLEEKTVEVGSEDSSGNFEKLNVMASCKVDDKNETEVSLSEEFGMNNASEASSFKFKEPLISNKESVTADENLDFDNGSIKNIRSPVSQGDLESDSVVAKNGVEKILEFSEEIVALETNHESADSRNVADDESIRSSHLSQESQELIVRSEEKSMMVHTAECEIVDELEDIKCLQQAEEELSAEFLQQNTEDLLNLIQAVSEIDDEIADVPDENLIKIEGSHGDEDNSVGMLPSSRDTTEVQVTDVLQQGPEELLNLKSNELHSHSNSDKDAKFIEELEEFISDSSGTSPFLEACSTYVDNKENSCDFGSNTVLVKEEKSADSPPQVPEQTNELNKGCFQRVSGHFNVECDQQLFKSDSLEEEASRSPLFNDKIEDVNDNLVSSSSNLEEELAVAEDDCVEDEEGTSFSQVPKEEEEGYVEKLADGKDTSTDVCLGTKGEAEAEFHVGHEFTVQQLGISSDAEIINTAVHQAICSNPPENIFSEKENTNNLDGDNCDNTAFDFTVENELILLPELASGYTWGVQAKDNMEAEGSLVVSEESTEEPNTLLNVERSFVNTEQALQMHKKEVVHNDVFVENYTIQESFEVQQQGGSENHNYVTDGETLMDLTENGLSSHCSNIKHDSAIITEDTGCLATETEPSDQVEVEGDGEYCKCLDSKVNPLGTPHLVDVIDEKVELEEDVCLKHLEDFETDKDNAGEELEDASNSSGDTFPFEEEDTGCSVVIALEANSGADNVVSEEQCEVNDANIEHSSKEDISEELDASLFNKSSDSFKYRATDRRVVSLTDHYYGLEASIFSDQVVEENEVMVNVHENASTSQVLDEENCNVEKETQFYEVNASEPCEVEKENYCDNHEHRTRLETAFGSPYDINVELENASMTKGEVESTYRTETYEFNAWEIELFSEDNAGNQVATFIAERTFEETLDAMMTSESVPEGKDAFVDEKHYNDKNEKQVNGVYISEPRETETESYDENDKQQMRSETTICSSDDLKFQPENASTVTGRTSEETLEAMVTCEDVPKVVDAYHIHSSDVVQREEIVSIHEEAKDGGVEITTIEEENTESSPSPVFVVETEVHDSMMQSTPRKDVERNVMDEIYSKLNKMHISSTVKRKRSRAFTTQRTPKRPSRLSTTGMKENVQQSSNVKGERSVTKRRVFEDLQNIRNR